MKTCSKCKETKDLKWFYVKRLECKVCVKRRTKAWHIQHSYRKYKKDICQACGFVPKHPTQLDVDHIDGNHSNNSLDNLQTLCANCHRLKTWSDKREKGLGLSYERSNNTN